MAETETRTFEHFKGQERVLSVKTNGGSVEVQVEHEPGVWITSDTISADDVSVITFGYALVRIVPSGGATYRVH
jgi:hypothetical protein